MFGEEIWWIHDGLKGMGSSLCAVPLARGVELHKVFNFTLLALQHWSASAAADPTLVGVELWAPKVGFLGHGGEYRKDFPQFDRAPVLIVNCSELTLISVFKQFAESPARKKGGPFAGLSEVVKFDENLSEVIIDPSYAPKFPSRCFIDGSALRSSIFCYAYGSKLSRDAWMRTKSAVCALVHAKLVGNEGRGRLAQSVKAVGSDDSMGNVVKLLMLVSLNNHNELVELLASLAGGEGIIIKLGTSDVRVAFFLEDFQAAEYADVEGRSSFVAGGVRNRGGGSSDKEVSALKGSVKDMGARMDQIAGLLETHAAKRRATLPPSTTANCGSLRRKRLRSRSSPSSPLKLTRGTGSPRRNLRPRPGKSVTSVTCWPASYALGSKIRMLRSVALRRAGTRSKM